MKIAAGFAVGLIALLCAVSTGVANAQSTGGGAQQASRIGTAGERYEGIWVTTKNKKLNGTASCQIRQLTEGRWQGRFWGVWQQVPFDYTVEFATANHEPVRPAEAQLDRSKGEAVRGTAIIDGADYDWVGTLSPTEFNIQFTGSRYHGHMELRRLADSKPAAVTSGAAQE